MLRWGGKGGVCLFQYNLKIDDAPILRLLDSILEEALRRNASDIHCEPGEEGTRVRCRIDGVLQQTQLVPSFRHQPLVSVIKLLGGMDIAEKRQPQDGRAFVERDGVRTDLRISTLPTLIGEKIVLRILAADRGQGKLDNRDWDARTLARYRRLYRGGCGLVLVTGPTGSGKTTTLYATLAELNHAEVNIVTLEDPVEYRLDGINQVAVNRKAGLTFVTGLRSLLRQDPDILMVGEIRDGETAGISIQAALTGHLVFSTLHTNTALGAVVRLLDMVWSLTWSRRPCEAWRPSAWSAVFVRPAARPTCLPRMPGNGAICACRRTGRQSCTGRRAARSAMGRGIGAVWPCGK